jgi:Peptidase_C39 like family
MSIKNLIFRNKKELNPDMQNRGRKVWLSLIAVVVLLAVVLSLPPVWSRVSYHSREAYRIVKYWLNPPSEAVFLPSTSNDGFLITLVSAAIPTSIPTVVSTTVPTVQPTTAPGAIPIQTTTEVTFSPAPTQPPIPIPMPSSILLRGIHCERQMMNNCGPASLSMFLSYYDWGKDQTTVAAVLKPNGNDVNVMPSELVDFVNQHTDLDALWRYGGDLRTIKVLLNAGFPVMIEKSFEPFTLRSEGWMGHYNLVVGYDDERQVLTVHDSYLMGNAAWGGEIPREIWDSFIGFDFYYSDLEQAWRSFNFVFVVVYPPERENEVFSALGPLANSEEAHRIAYDRAQKETTSLTAVRDKFFAWFNAGTSLVALQEYAAAAIAYDTAFGIYPDIEMDSRPYRILWYETGPYAAYYYSERYQDVINLANQTLGYMAEPVIEESYYWRAMSYYALGNTNHAIDDLRTSLEYHPGYKPSIDMLKQLGLAP